MFIVLINFDIIIKLRPINPHRTSLGASRPKKTIKPDLIPHQSCVICFRLIFCSPWKGNKIIANFYRICVDAERNLQNPL